MAKLPPQTSDSPTVQAIYAMHEASRDHRQSRRLGASEAGSPCDRAIWYGFRWWAASEQFDGLMLRLFEHGHKAEEIIAEDLRRIGCEIHLVNLDTLEQFELTGCDGHLVCKLDGAILGVPEAPKTWHVWECKTHNAKSFKDLKAKGVKASKPQHYVQCILGMELSGMKRCLYLAENKDTSELYTERLRHEECKDDIKAVMDRCQAIINAIEPPERISSDPESSHCKWCRFLPMCHEGASPLTTCRSCQHSKPVGGGEWWCGQHSTKLSVDQQLGACDLYEITVGVLDALKKNISLSSKSGSN